MIFNFILPEIRIVTTKNYKQNAQNTKTLKMIELLNIQTL